MRTWHTPLVVALVLGLALAACAPSGPATDAPADPTPLPGNATEPVRDDPSVPSGPATDAPADPTPLPGGTAEPVGDEQIGPSGTATAEPIVEQITPHSKYDKVYVYTVEEQANEGRSLLHVAYPVTEHPAINARLRALSEPFIDEFHTQAALQETAYQDYVLRTGEKAASFVTHYIQHFDVTLADANLISLAIERYRFGGGTGSIEISGHVFDRLAGTELAQADLFVSDVYLERLSILAREELERRARAEAADAAFDSEAAREEWLTVLLGMIHSGTEPRADNFAGLLFHDDGTLHIQFDKYQVAPGSDGVVTVILPIEDIVDLLTPRMRQLLGIAPAAPTPAPSPSPSPEPPPTAAPFPTPTLAPPTPGAGASPGPVDCAQAPCVALTFDDGPSVYTEALLDVLQSHGARATFFVLGKSARVQRETLTRMADEGHEIGNHSWSHLNMKQLTEDEVREQIDLTNALVAEVTSVAPSLFRPPYGAYDDYVVETVQMPVVLWSLDPLDWQDRDADLVAERMSEASAGAIILAHDIHPSTVEAMPAVLESLAARGIHFVTVSELMAPTELVSGRTYSRRPIPR